VTARAPDPGRAARQQIVRRATLYSLAFMFAGLLVAVVGAALVAWLLSRGGLPFGRTWAILVIVIVLPGLVATIWKSLRGR
jgi:ABC-type sulfate transport system permease component